MVCTNPTAKDLIKNLLKTNPQERIKIDGALRHPWIAFYNKVPETPLASVHVLKDEAEVWGDVQVHVYVGEGTEGGREGG